MFTPLQPWSGLALLLVTAQDFLKLFQERFGGDFQKLTDSRERYLIQIIGSELSRGRGGPRCLTMPLEREV